MIKVSVVIPVYNGEAYLEECMDSILFQTLKEIEVICVDDGSTDHCSELLQKYKEMDSRVKVITNQRNYGPGTSRNKGLEKARGKYVIFLDADDVFEKELLELAFSRAEIYQTDICIFREDEFSDSIKKRTEYPYSRFSIEKLEKRGVFSPNDVKDVLFNLWNGWAWDKLFLREFVLENGLWFQEMWSSEDGFFVHAAMASAKRLTCLNKVLVHHRVNRSSSISNSKDSSWECCCFYLEKLYAYLTQKGLYETFEKSFINWVPAFLYWNFLTLKEANRNQLFYKMKNHIWIAFELVKYDRRQFYNPFYYWMIHTIKASDCFEECKIPVDKTGRWMFMFRENEEKMEALFRYMEKRQYKGAVWGAGERGIVFLDRYGGRKELKKIFDKDSRKTGQVIKEGYVVEAFDDTACKEIDLIIVTNTDYYESIVSDVKKVCPNIQVFDLEAYQDPVLSFPFRLEEWIQ